LYGIIAASTIVFINYTIHYVYFLWFAGFLRSLKLECHGVNGAGDAMGPKQIAEIGVVRRFASHKNLGILREPSKIPRRLRWRRSGRQTVRKSLSQERAEEFCVTEVCIEISLELPLSDRQFNEPVYLFIDRKRAPKNVLRLHDRHSQ
jgi:hypothetical protein